ncbi:MAG: aspartate-semialdehyde dehydrogenase [Planctomycetota bacterium]|nr:MAG: aspartate-semialdehyde dehydrogenase [Planctomycetota bacterium]
MTESWRAKIRGRLPARPRLAIAGASGAVGREFLALLAERQFPFAELRLLASSASKGREFGCRGESYVVEELGPDSFLGIDLAFFSCGASRTRDFAPAAMRSGAIVIDNSSAYRMDAGLPLVVPEVNPEALSKETPLIANPNCATILLVQSLAVIQAAFGLRRVVVSSYQAASGAGQQAMQALVCDLREMLAPRKALAESPGRSRDYFGQELAFNVIPQIGDFDASGQSQEERKIQRESRKILGQEQLAMDVTCVRVPVLRSHSMSVSVECESEVDPARLRALFVETPGLSVIDGADGARYPMPLDCSGRDFTAVGRLRRSEVFAGGISYWLCGDQLRKGAALNAIQIAELLLP